MVTITPTHFYFGGGLGSTDLREYDLENRTLPELPLLTDLAAKDIKQAQSGAAISFDRTTYTTVALLTLGQRDIQLFTVSTKE